MYCQPSMSVGSESEESTNHRWKIFKKNVLLLLEVYYKVRPMMVESVPNRYRFSFPCHCSLNNRV